MLESEAVTHYNGAPTVQIGVVTRPRRRRSSSARCGDRGGCAALAARLAAQGAEFRPVHVYGLTETYALHTVFQWHSEWDACPPRSRPRIAARQGQGYAVFDLVRLSTTHARRPQEARRWRGRDARQNVARVTTSSRATAESFRGGWFHSGISASASRRLHRAARPEKDIIISAVRTSHHRGGAAGQASRGTGVRGGGHPDEKWASGRRPSSRLKAGASATEADISSFCRQHIARFKCPLRWSRDLPKTSTGKIQSSCSATRVGRALEADQLSGGPR